MHYNWAFVYISSGARADQENFNNFKLDGQHTILKSILTIYFLSVMAIENHHSFGMRTAISIVAKLTLAL